MPGDPLKKVLPGQALEIPAEAWNSVLDAALDLKSRKHSREQNVSPETRQSGIKVRNDSEGDRARFDVLGIDEPIIGPDANLRQFKNQVALKGKKPGAEHTGNFVVLLEPLADGAIGRAVAAGVTIGRVNVDPANQGFSFADVQADEPGHLELTETGSAQVLWREDGLGVKWAVLRLGNDPLGLSIREEDGDPTLTDVLSIIIDQRTGLYLEETPEGDAQIGMDLFWKEVDGDPEVHKVKEVHVDQTTGLKLEDLGGGAVRLKIDTAVAKSVTITESKNLQLILDQCILRLRWQETIHTLHQNNAGLVVGVSSSVTFDRESSIDLCLCNCSYYGGGGY